MLKITVCLLAMLLQNSQQLVIRNHDISKQLLSHQLFSPGQFFQSLQFIGFLAVIIAVGVGCYYCRGFMGNNNERVVVVQPNIERNHPRPVMNNQSQSHQQPAPIIEQKRSAPAAGNPMMQYFTSIKSQPVQKDGAHLVDSNNPYITKKQAILNLKKWDDNNQNLATDSCAICSTYNKSGQYSRVIVNCSSDHSFHLSCLSDYRNKQTVQMGGNGVNKCPKCRESYSPVVRYFCDSCKLSSISINLVKYSDDSGRVQLNSIINQYGERCQNCHGF